MNKRCVVTGLVLSVAAVVAGCSSLDLGPEPSSFVGPNDHGATSLTDPNLNAVTPLAAPEVAQGVVEYGAATTPGEGTTPETMPSATQPITTQPVTATANPQTRPGLSNAPASQPTPTRNARGHVDVPAELDVQNAILVGLENNVGLQVQKINVPIQRTGEETQRAAFDPNVSANISGGHTVGSVGTSSRSATTQAYSLNADASISEFLPTGTKVSATITSDNTFYTDNSSSLDGGLSITQSLLRGAGVDVNLVSLRSAEVNTRITQFELRGFAEDLVANIEETYWDLAYAERQVVIVENALKVAQEELDSTNASIRVERVAPSERAAAQAQVEFEKEQLIAAKSTLETTRLKFLQLITPAGEPFWDRTVTLQTQPFVPQGEMDPVDKHVGVGLRLRPEMNETKLQIQQNDLTVVQTKNGLLPQLDFFVNLDKTSFATSFGNAVSDLNGPDYSAFAGLTGNFDPVNRAEKAAYRSAILTREQTLDSLRNLEQTVQFDVRSQYIQVQTAREQIDATRATREADEISLQVETAKFREGRSTSLLVAQTQQTLLSAQLAEELAVTSHLKALVELYRLEGSLLYRRGIDAPGGKPVEGPAWH
jgi:outer membrane protein